MISAGEVIVSRLANATAAAGRIYPAILPQNPTYPAITYQEISSVRTHAMGQDGPMTRVRAQVNVWATSHAEARAVANQVANSLSRYWATIGATRVLDVLLDNDMTFYESETQTRRVTQDYTLFLTT